MAETCRLHRVRALLWFVAAIGLLFSAAPLHAQDARGQDTDALTDPFLSEVAPVAGDGQPAWVEIAIGRVAPPLPPAAFLPFVQGGGSEQAAAAAAPAAPLAGAVAIGGWKISDLDGNEYVLPAALPNLPAGTVVLILFDGQGETANELDPSDGRITLHTPAGLVAIFDEGGDQVALFDETGALVDFVAWGVDPGEDGNAAAEAGIWLAGTFVTYDDGFGAGGVLNPDAPNQSIGIWQAAPESDLRNWQPYAASDSSPGAPNPLPAPLHSTLPANATVGVLTPANAAEAGVVTDGRKVGIAWSGLGPDYTYEIEVDGNTELAPEPSWSAELTPGDHRLRLRTVDARGYKSAYLDLGVITVIDLDDFVSLGTKKSLLAANEYKIQHKDTTMLDIGGGTNNIVGNNNAGDRRYPADRNWDAEHVDGNGVPRFGWNGIDNIYCVRASTAMINDYFGGTLSQDRLSYYAFEELNQDWYGSPANLRGFPEHDLGFGVGIGSYAIQEKVLSWALGDLAVTAENFCPTPSIADYNCPNPGGDPMSFDEVKSLIDAGRPFVSINLKNAHARVVDGYWDVSANSRWVHLIDPVPVDTNACPTCTNAQWISYATFADNHERLIVGPASVPSPRQSEASIGVDSDGDGINNFDEVNRFGTNPNNPDTDGDWVNDKNDLAEYIFDVSAVGVYVYTPGMSPKTSDFDSDNLRKEKDWDNDGDGAPDGCEDTNQDGEFDGNPETSNFDKNSKQVCQPRFQILNPRNGQAANAGDPAAPDHLLIRLSVALPPALPNKPVFGSAQFSATIGGLPAPVLSGAQVGQEFWLLVQAPVQSESKFYDLVVGFDGGATSHNDQSDTETNAVYYIPRPPMDTMLVFDTSGSMNDGTKLADAKNAARLYIDQWAAGDMLGLVTFDDTANVDKALTVIQSNLQVLTDTKNLVTGLVAGGQTAMGAGLLAGQNQLDTTGVDDHTWSMMLLTDGQENVAPFWNDAAVSGVIIPSQTIVNTVGLGDTNATFFSLLQQIAGGTGGQFAGVNDPTVAAASEAAAAGDVRAAGEVSPALLPASTANQLANAYKYAAEQVLGEQRLLDANGILVPRTNPTDDYRIIVVDSKPLLIGANFNLANRGALTVTDANGHTLTPTDAGVEFRSDATHLQYRIENPPLGAWSIQVARAAVAGAQPAVEYLLFASSDAKLTLNLAVAVPPFTATAGPPPPALVLAFLADAAPVTGATVEVNVTLPTGAAGAPVTLHDDGANGDQTANDGIYSGRVAVGTRGMHVVQAKATVNLPGQGEVTRFAQTTFVY